MESQSPIQIHVAGSENSDASTTSSPRRNEHSNPLREEFNKFIDNARLSVKREYDSAFDEIISTLKIKKQSILDIVQLSEAFETLMSQIAESKRCRKHNWTELEVSFLISIVAHYCNFSSEDLLNLGDKDWQSLEAVFPTKQASQITKRWNSILKVDLRQHPWTAAEDAQLKVLVGEFGAEKQWKKIAEKINSSAQNSVFRQPRQCRERWINYVNPQINKGDWSKEEDLKLLNSFVTLGKRWADISKALGDRTENAVRNRLLSLIKKEVLNGGSLDENLSFKDETFEMKVVTGLIEKLSTDAQKQPVASPTQQALDHNLANYQILPQMPQQTLPVQNVCLPLNSFGYFPSAPQNLFNANAFSNQLALFEAQRRELLVQQNLKAMTGNNFGWMSTQNVLQANLFNPAFNQGNNMKADSKVFLALVETNSKQVRILDKLPQESWPRLV